MAALTDAGDACTGEPLKATMLFCLHCGAPTNAPPCPSGCPPGDLRAVPELARFVREENILGEGSFAKVYPVRRVADRTRWAMKVIHLTAEGDARSESGFRTEAAILRDSTHPGLVRFLAAGTAGPRLMFMVTERVERTLKAALPLRGTPMPFARVTRIAVQVAEALVYLHEKTPQVLHRDLKPANVGLDAQDRVRLFDFGLAAVRAPAHFATQTLAAARTAMVKGDGTPMYAPPEQMHVDPDQQRTGAYTDLFSLGAILYRLVTGEPFRPEAVTGDLQTYLEAPAPPLPPSADRPAGFDELVMRCLEPRWEHRAQDTRRVLEALEAFADEAQIGRVFAAYRQQRAWLQTAEQRRAEAEARAAKAQAAAEAAEARARTQRDEVARLATERTAQVEALNEAAATLEQVEAARAEALTEATTALQRVEADRAEADRALAQVRALLVRGGAPRPVGWMVATGVLALVSLALVALVAAGRPVAPPVVAPPLDAGLVSDAARPPPVDAALLPADVQLPPLPLPLRGAKSPITVRRATRDGQRGLVIVMGGRTDYVGPSDSDHWELRPRDLLLSCAHEAEKEPTALNDPAALDACFTRAKLPDDAKHPGRARVGIWRAGAPAPTTEVIEIWE